MGDLATINDRYDVAVSTACGGSLDSIVVDTVACGQQCIEFLKRDNIGRATFQCLDKIQKSNISKIKTPENAPRLFDLIHTDEKYRFAFYQAVGDTLVANDLEQANRIAYGTTRYRVVTLDGQLIDKSGTMSGGGNKLMKGGMSSKRSNEEISPAQLQSLEIELQTSKENLDIALNEGAALKATIIEIKKELEEYKRLVMKINLDLESLSNEIVDAEKNLEIAKY
jgi:structural maintenance of chromosome 4